MAHMISIALIIYPSKAKKQFKLVWKQILYDYIVVLVL